MSRIGGHISIADGLLKTCDIANALNYTFYQVFMRSKISLDASVKDAKTLSLFREKLEKLDQKIVIHGSYCVNLCHPKESDKAVKMRKCVVAELFNAAQLKDRCVGAIIHMGCKLKMDENDAMINFAENINLILEESKEGTLILETGAGEGTEVCTMLDKLFEMYELIEDKDRIRFCIDTCHIFAAGYDVSTKDGVKKFFDTFKFFWDIEKIACFHFNDSLKECGCKVDRHADLTFGKIGEEGLKEIARFAKENEICLVTETPAEKIDAVKEMEMIREWMGE